MKSLKYLTLAVLLYAGSAFPWGRVGHETIAYIAEKNLSSSTMEKIKPLLSGKSLKDISTWADDYKRNHKNTAPWHYINLPVRQNVTVNDLSQYFTVKGRQGNNVVSQIKKDITELKDSRTSFKDKQVALKYLVHFVGDLHMPLHVGDDNDKGGNEKKVRYFAPTSHSNKGHVTNLHSLWDNLIEIKAAENPSTLGDELNSRISSTEKQKWSSGTIEDWSVESYSVAKDEIYSTLLSDISLPKNYHSKMRPICDEQLEKAGVRLAKILEDVFGK